ncbi:helix-turn-helix domain-containing protein [Chryseobacterium sp. Tr-659]|uniref:helix-turn-helix domain-containing protein n=1 Tax=Chryseobacterium sp. Tr-659 TaxID=2608340 RepID=UPI0014202DEA|nr:helix-turn-helix domain-containing protein [Chryseobacterium sp. Tr-659]NIF07438.1 helix-turn-helix domain-containing protein [Chryseobacterium sp. Tr-659]
MTYNFKDIHIGEMILTCVKDREIDMTRLCTFFKCSIDKIEQMYECKTLESDLLLKWSKLLEYDLFRIYSQHLIMYSPPTARAQVGNEKTGSSLPQFRKSLYTKEIIEFVLELLNNGTKTKNQIIEEYRIPKTTLYKWVHKYHTTKNTI